MDIPKKGIAACCLITGMLLCGCGGSSRSAEIGWSGEKVRLRLDPSSSRLFSKPTLTCVSCAVSIPPFPVSPDAAGVVDFDFPPAKDQITTRFYLETNGLDTALILQPPSPEVASSRYHLPITGRVLVTHLAMVYRDTTIDSAVSTLEREDEVNIFGENDLYYFIHHPAYSEPLVILKSHAVRIR